MPGGRQGRTRTAGVRGPGKGCAARHASTSTVLPRPCARVQRLGAPGKVQAHTHAHVCMGPTGRRGAEGVMPAALLQKFLWESKLKHHRTCRLFDTCTGSRVRLM